MDETGAVDYRPRFTRIDAGLIMVLLVVTALAVEWQTHNKALLGINFLSTDEGVSLLVADVLAHGGKLYKDIAYPYGYLPAELHAFAVRLFGNSVRTYLHYFLVVDLVVIGLLYALVRRILLPWAAFLFVLLVMIPETISPGALCGGAIANAAYPLEPVFLLGVALLWREPTRQSWQRALLIGLLLGAMQGVKFGTGLVLGAALAVVEGLAWYQSGSRAGTALSLLRNNFCVLGGFLFMEGVWIAVTLANVPAEIARDVLWPFYMVANYGSYPVGMRYPQWSNLGYFVGIQMVPAVGALASLCWLGARCFRRERLSAPAGPTEFFSSRDPGRMDGVLILLIFYLLAHFVLFKHVWHYYVFAWILMLGGLYLLIQPYRVIRWAALVLWAGNLLLFARANVHKSSSLVPLTLDTGEQLWVTPQKQAQVKALVGYLRADAAAEGGPPRPVVFYPAGSGFHPLYHFPHEGRPSWFIVGFLRPYDDATVAKLARTARWVVAGGERMDEHAPADPALWDANQDYQGQVFDAPTRAEVQARLVGETVVDHTYWVYSPAHPGTALAPASAEPGQSPAPTIISP